MSEQQQGSLDSHDETAVIEYLRAHPDFFLRHEYVLSELRLTHPDSGKAISLIERQVEILREQRQELKHRLQQLTQTARDNEHLLERIEQLILRLLEADELASLTTALRKGLREDFHADAVELVLFRDRPELAANYANLFHRHEP